MQLDTWSDTPNQQKKDRPPDLERRRQPLPDSEEHGRKHPKRLRKKYGSGYSQACPKAKWRASPTSLFSSSFFASSGEAWVSNFCCEGGWKWQRIWQVATNLVARRQILFKISLAEFDRESWRRAWTCMSRLIICSKSDLPLCEAIGGFEERYPLNWWPWKQYHA